MKLLLKKEEGKKGFIAGKPKYTLAAKVELSPKEMETYQHFHLNGTILYRADANTESFRQYMGTGGKNVELVLRLLPKKKSPDIKAFDLVMGLTFEDEFVLSIIDIEERVKEAANVLYAAITAASEFLGERSLDLPIVSK
jgi:hypothetical protein